MTSDEAPLHDVAEQRFVSSLRAVLEAQGKSQSALATMLGDVGLTWTQTTVSRVLSGNRGVSLGEAAAIAAALEVPLEAMLHDGAVVAGRAAILSAVERVEHALRSRDAAESAVVAAREVLAARLAEFAVEEYLGGPERDRVAAALGSFGS